MKGFEIIPRKDHETFILERSRENFPQGKKISVILEDYLQENQPGFSRSMRYDVKKIKTKKKKWVLLTVMDKVVLADYQYRSKGKKISTASVLYVSSRRYMDGHSYRVGDEIFGYSSETDELFSAPTTVSESTLVDIDVEDLLSTVSSGGEIFSKKIPLIRIGGLVASLFVFVACVFVAHRSDPVTTVIPPETTESAAIVKANAPDFFTVFHDISLIAREQTNVITQFTYDEQLNASLVTVAMRGGDPLRVSNKYSIVPYLTAVTVSGLEYADDQVRYSISGMLNTAHFQVPTNSVNISSDDFLKFLNTLREINVAQGLIPHSEVVSPGIQNAASERLTLTLSDFDPFLNNLRQSLRTHSLRIVRFIISRNQGTNELSLDYGVRRFSTTFDDKTDEVIISRNSGCFGPLEANAENGGAIADITSSESNQPLLEKVGIIHVSDKKNIVFYRDRDGKISTQEE